MSENISEHSKALLIIIGEQQAFNLALLPALSQLAKGENEEAAARIQDLMKRCERMLEQHIKLLRVSYEFPNDDA